MRKLKIHSSGTELIGESASEHTDFLLLHAGGERKTVWRPVQERLAVAGYGAVAFDQRGHGESGGSVADGVEALGQDAVEMSAAFPTAKVLVGGSLGGLAALFAAANSDQTRLAGLVMVDVTPAPDPERSVSYLQGQGGNLANSPLVASILSQRNRFEAAARRLELPVLLVRAGPTSPITDAQVAHFRSLCPQLRVALIDRATHLIARDAPIELADTLIDFIQSTDVSTRRLSAAVA
ncbi:MAG: alpha/beta hydrolase [Pseudomonadota bacterium]